MADDAYDRDFYDWTRAQARALRARGAGGNELDYDNLAEEIEGLGRSERNAVASYVRRIIEHLHKLRSSRNAEVRPHWLDEIANFRIEAQDRVTPSILRLVEDDLERLHVQGAKLAQASMDRHEPGTLIDADKRWSLAELLDEDSDAERLAAADSGA